VYAKTEPRPPGRGALWAFQESLAKLGHFHTKYTNIEDLKLQFRGQLDKLLEQEDEFEERPRKARAWRPRLKSIDSTCLKSAPFPSIIYS